MYALYYMNQIHELTYHIPVIPQLVDQKLLSVSRLLPAPALTYLFSNTEYYLGGARLFLSALILPLL